MWNWATKLENFVKNYYRVEEHNEGFRRGTKSFEMEINPVSHLSSRELREMKTGGVVSTAAADTSHIAPGNHSWPLTEFSWLNYPNIIGPVQDQGQCGSCTNFAVIGAMEAHMRIWYGINTKLSEQEAMQCCGQCDGSYVRSVYAYADNGATSGDDFKYVGKPLESCNKNRPRVHGSKVVNYYKIKTGENFDEDVRWYLTHIGPLVTTMCVTSSFQMYKRGVFDDEDLTDCGWHAMLIVGFDVEDGQRYWHLRNSWGKRRLLIKLVANTY